MPVLKAPQGMGGEILLSLHNSKTLGGEGVDQLHKFFPFLFIKATAKRNTHTHTHTHTPLVISLILQLTVSTQSMYLSCHILACFLQDVFHLYTEWLVRGLLKYYLGNSFKYTSPSQKSRSQGFFVLFCFAMMNWDLT